MKKIQNVFGRDREIAALGLWVAADETVEVPKDLADALCAQPANWKPANTTTSKKKES